MARRIDGYVDTSAFISYLDSSDTYHALFARLFSEAKSLVSSPLVIAEGHAWFLKRFDELKAISFLSFIESLNILRFAAVGETEIRAATSIIRRYKDQKLTMTDAVGIYIMKQEKISNCWSTDRHLGLGGVRLVIHS